MCIRDSPTAGQKLTLYATTVWTKNGSEEDAIDNESKSNWKHCDIIIFSYFCSTFVK